MVTDTRFVRGAEKLGRRVATIRANLNLPSMVDEIGNLLLQRTLRRFDQEVDPDGNRWAALKESTILRRRQMGLGPSPKLVRTRDMRDAIKLIKGGIQGAIFTNTGAGVRIGIDDEEIAKYGRAQNYGVPGRIVARRFLGIGRLDVKAVDSLLRRKASQLGLE